MQSAQDIAQSIPKNAPVAVTLVDDWRIKPEFKGKTLHGFWLGVTPNPQVHDSVRSDYEGEHWLCHVLDVRSYELCYDLRLDTIEKIDVSSIKVGEQR